MQITSGNKKIGNVIGDTLLKQGRQVILFRKYDGFGIPVNVLEQVDKIRIVYDGNTYKTTADTYKTHGIPYTYRNEKQLILPRRYFDTTNQERLF